MGTHPSLPSTVVDSGKPLSDLIKAEPEQLLGSQIRSKFQADDLPYLFKVLSIGKALSIQAHPDKALGKKLHEQRPDVYKGARSRRPVCKQCDAHIQVALCYAADPNHKVRMIQSRWRVGTF